MTKDELFKDFLVFVSCDGTTPYQSETIRSLIYQEVMSVDKTTMFPAHLGTGLLYAFVQGVQSIDPNLQSYVVDRKLKVLAEELFLHLKAELS